MKENKKEKGKVSRRDFLAGAGATVVGTIGAGILAGCGGGDPVTETVTTTKVSTVPTTVTIPGGTGAVVTTTATVSKFICPVDGLEFDSLAALEAHYASAHSGQEPAAAANMVSLTVNGQQYTLMVEPWDTLRNVLREQLGLISIKDMCYGYGACGSCTVIMDGRPILSCMTLACECNGVTIETAEGIAKANHPLIETYIANHCMQCGYCTPGFVATSKALLDRNPNPSEEDIREALAGNLCRCATYIQHIPAVQEAAAQLGGM